MLKKEFNSEISEVVLKSNKDEFSRLAGSVEYFKSKHKELSEKYQEEIEQKSDHKKWSSFLRGFRFWQDLGIPYMYKRTMQLSLRFTNKYDEFFKIESEIGSFTLPTRLDKFLKISLIAKEFVHEIYPSIEKNINFKSEMIVETNQTIQGTVDWNGTILNSLQRGESHPTQFTCLINQNNFETSENILALICLLKLHDDLESLVFNTNEIEYVKKESRMILDLKMRIDFLISHTHMKDFAAKYEKYRYSNLKSKVIKDYENETRENIEKGKIRQKSYSDLLMWLKKYKGYNLEGIMQKYGEFPIQHERSLDTMYELWIYFEILNYFKNQNDVKILSSMKNSSGGFAGFEIEMLGKKLKFKFQDDRTGWTGEKSTPDFTIEMDGEIPIIMDPKNYSTTQTGDAFHKMLGYMVNLGKFNPNKLQPSLGILFFPYGIDRNEDENGNYQPIKESTDTVFGKKMTFSTIILNPTKPEEMKENLKNVYENVCEIVRSKIRQK
jgi:hypothetical protein